MGRSLILFVWLVASTSLVGCFVIDDLDGYETELGCDLAFEARFFDPHVGQLFRFDVVRTVDGAIAGSSDVVAVFDPLPTANFDLTLPNAVPRTVRIGDGYALEFFGDANDNGGLDEPGSDHTWFVPNACDEGPIRFNHNFEFQDIQRSSRSAGPALVLDFCESFPTDVPVEVRVTGIVPPNPEIPGDVEDVRAIAFYRADLSRGDTIIEVDGVFANDQTLQVEIISDGGEMGVVDGDDFVLEYDYRPSETGAVERCEDFTFLCEEANPAGNFGCFAPNESDGELHFVISVEHDNAKATPRQASWWAPVPEDEED